MEKIVKQKEKFTVMGLFFLALAKYPALSIMATGLNIFALILFVLIPWYYKKFFDALSSGLPKEQAVKMAIAAIVVIAGLNAARWIARRISEWSVCKLQPKIMQDMTLVSFSYILHQSFQFFSNNFSGSLMRKINRLSQAFENIHDTLHYTITTIVISIVGSIWLITTRSLMVAAIFSAWVLGVFVFNLFFSRRLRALRLRRAALDTENSGVISDALTNSTNVRLFSADQYEFNLLKKVSTELRNIRQLSWDKHNTYTFTQLAVLMFIEFATIYWCIISWQAGALTVGDIVLVQSILLKLGDMIWNMNQVFRNFYESYADAQEMVDILNIKPCIQDVPRAKDIKVAEGHIVFTKTVFNYNETRTVLKDFSLDIRPGEKVALVGPSGAGKSTVVKTLFRLYDATAGEITIDGQDIAKVTQDSLHDALSLVPQEPLLFHRSLMDNIRYGKRDASDEEVYAAAKKAHCHEFISNLSDGYKTLVGERGIKLSGGERQRVAIARAILKDAPILVLDEATSSLDSESEHLIQEALKELMKNKTVIVIAHRLSTIMEMDRIIVLDNGEIIDQGTHASLLKKSNGLYKKLWEIQAGGFIS